VIEFAPAAQGGPPPAAQGGPPPAALVWQICAEAARKADVPAHRPEDFVVLNDLLDTIGGPTKQTPTVVTVTATHP
jgi:hypothetical protein